MALAISFVLEWGFGFTPCLLCVFDRMVFFLLALVYLFACLHRPKGYTQLIYGLLALLLCLFGIALTGRHLWLLKQPHATACSSGLGYLFEILSLKEILEIVLNNASCTDAPTFLGLPLPALTMLSFILVALATLLPWYAKDKKG